MLKKCLFILSLVVGLMFSNQAFSQLNYEEVGRKKLYFGIAMGFNASQFSITPQPASQITDSLNTILSSYGPGFNLGIIGNYQFHKYFDLRMVPGLVFSDKHIDYSGTVDEFNTRKTISSIFVDVPISLRFKAAPIRDFRFFVLGGVRYSYDLASNQESRVADDQIVVRRHDFRFEYGVGVQIYFQFFVMSPTLKFSHGVINIHDRRPENPFSRVIDKLFSRAITLTINLEG